MPGTIAVNKSKSLNENPDFPDECPLYALSSAKFLRVFLDCFQNGLS